MRAPSGRSVAELDHPEREERTRRGRQSVVRVRLVRGRGIEGCASTEQKFVELLGEDPR